MSIVRRCLRPGSAWLTALLLLMAMVCASMGVAHAAETITYYYTSPQGTVLAKADASGNIISSTDYRPYGTQALGTPEQGPGYTGHVNDTVSGFVYMQARYYDPEVGRFLSNDPMPSKAGNLFTPARYTYANNNPTLNIDPDGRQAFAGWSDSQVHAVALNPGAGATFTGIVLTSLPIIGDVANIVEAVQDPSPVNIAAAAIGIVPEGGGPAASVIRLGTSGGERAGKVFTRMGKIEVKEINAAAHEGKIVCEACGRETVPALQSQKGVTPPGNEAHVDHIIAKSKNGDGSPSNGQVLCRDCNLDKGAD
ncbi:RHS repeat-associated core domain-containing protein [Xanthomonas sp. NCPPB 2632]|uniref:RHS repeat-associated core domain-containing protein n=1 Tax=Xanthomonas sp. NCPPB 2632 TaxID=3240912 RepID=UPI0035118AD3